MSPALGPVANETGIYSQELESVIEQIRVEVPELKNASDEMILEFMTEN